MRRVTLAVVVDAALILLFAALGRRTHDEGSAVGGTLTVSRISDRRSLGVLELEA